MIKDILYELKNYYEIIRKNGGLFGIKSNIPIKFDGKSLDEVISGFIKGKVYTIAGYTNVGKSNFMYYILANLIKQYKFRIGFFSTEVEKKIVLMKLIQSFYGIPFDIVEKKIIENEKEIIEKFENIFIYDDIIDIEEIERKIEEEKYDIVVIDFIQGINAFGKNDLYEKYSFLARKIQRLAIEKNIIFFSVAQVTSGIAKGQPVFSIKGAGEFMESSDVVFYLQRIKENALLLSIEKNKFGPNQVSTMLKADFEKVIFY